MRSYGERFLRFERKPTISGGSVRNPVGGEILPVNSLQILLANLWWIFLLAIPILLYWLTAKYGVRIPQRLRQALMLIPLVVSKAG